MKKIKDFVKRFVKKDGIIYRIIRKIYHILSTIKYKIVNNKKIKEQNKHYTNQVNKASEIIKEYKDKEYIVFYNPTWLGVANSTKGLFKNIVPLEQVFGKDNINKIARTVVENNIKSVIFSQIVDGWIDVIKQIKLLNSNIDIKVIWHGNCYEFFSDYTWNLNKDVMNLYKQGQINCFGFVRSTMYEFYKKVGFKSCYLQNNVHLDKIENINKIEDKQIKQEQATGTAVKSPIVGVFYSASSPESEPYVTVGKNVKKGDIVCIIEAMKVMNEIKAPCDGTVTSILVENEALVEYDQALMVIE